jgi:diguanylate cyclase (GGDEF)-like protein
MGLDVSTLHIAIIGALMFAAVVMGAMRRVHPEETTLTTWMWANILLATAGLLFGWQGKGPDWLTIIVANLASVTGTGLYVIGICQYFGKPARPRVFVPLLVAVMLGELYWLYVEPLLWARIVNVSLFTLLTTGYAVYIIARARRTDVQIAIRFLLFGFGQHVVLFLTRIAGALVYKPDTQYLDPHSPFIAFALMLMLMDVFVVNTSFVLLVAEKLQRRLTHLATIDELTGLLNRRAFNDQARGLIADATRTRRPVAVLLMDLDFFKLVNDRFGHHVGDELLRCFAEVLQRAVRGGDIVGRMGGEEFCAMLPTANRREAYQVAERIRGLAAEVVLKAGDARVHTTLSAGVAVVTAGDTLEKVLARADRALYEAKNGGRNRVILDVTGDDTDDVEIDLEWAPAPAR